MQKTFLKTDSPVVSEEKKQLDVSKYKTTMCKSWKMNGSCDYEDKCAFAHGESDLRRMPPTFSDKMCIEMETYGTCRFGNRCRYAHSESEMKRSVFPEIPAVERKPIERKASFDEEFPELPVRKPAAQTGTTWAKVASGEVRVEKVEKKVRKESKAVERNGISPSSLSESELMEFTKEHLSPTGKINFADDDPNEEFNPEELTDKLKDFMSKKTEEILEKVEVEKVNRFEKIQHEKSFKKAIGTERVQNEKIARSLEDRAKDIKISDLVLLRDSDPVLFGYCVGMLAGQKML